MSKPETVPTSPTVPALEAKVFTSVRWVAVGQVVAQSGRFFVSIIVAHLLTPGEFGLMAMAAVLITVASLFPTLGLGQAIVQRRQTSEMLLRTLATLAVVAGTVLSGLLALGAWGAATTLFAETRVAAIVAVLGGQFAIQGFSAVPESVLQREMRLDRLVLIDLAHLVTGSTTAVVLVFQGWGVWALVTGNLVGAVVRSWAIILASPWKLRFGFRAAELRGLAGFGTGVIGCNLVNYIARFADRVAIGRLLGATNLGLYDYACRLYWYPLEVIAPVLIAVMFPALSQVQDDHVRLGRAFLRANGLIAFVACPIMIGLAAVADPFVPVLLGERWQAIVPLVEILAPAGMLTAMAITTGELFYATGRPMLRFWWASINAAVTLAAVAVGMLGGIRGVAIALACVRLPLTIAAFSVALRLVRLSVVDLWRTVRPALLLAIVMGTCVGALRMALLRTVLPPPLILGICVSFGIAIYAAGARLYPTPAMADFYRLLPALLQRRPFVAWLFEPIHRRPA